MTHRRARLSREKEHDTAGAMRRTRFTSVASLTLVAVVFTALCVVPTPSSAIEAKCSACEAVAAELQEALENERPRNHLDMRGRLDSKGIRYGKMIDYKVGRPEKKKSNPLTPKQNNNAQLRQSDGRAI